ncbi:MAG: cyclic lactone autoinducer peptide [Firmicutes bacterium]|nr:cyclic lactone autoinducer peptide [Bacillota bacterium]
MRALAIRLLVALAGLLTFISMASAASACTWLYYEPEVPAKLRRE